MFLLIGSYTSVKDTAITTGLLQLYTSHKTVTRIKASLKDSRQTPRKTRQAKLCGSVMCSQKLSDSHISLSLQDTVYVVL